MSCRRAGLLGNRGATGNTTHTADVASVVLSLADDDDGMGAHMKLIM